MNWTLDLEVAIQALPKRHKNIRTLKALEDLVSNLDKINIADVEALTFIPVPDLIYKYDLYVKDGGNSFFKMEGWIAINEDYIPNKDKIPELLKKGVLRLHNPYLKDLIGKCNYKNL